MENTTQEQQKDMGLVQWTKPAETQFTKCDWNAGLYPAKIKEVQDTEGKYGKMKRFIFIVKDAQNSKEAELAWVAYPRVNVSTKMGKALLSLGVKEGTSFTWEQLKGKECKVYIKPSTYKNKKGEIVNATTIQDINPC